MLPDERVSSAKIDSDTQTVIRNATKILLRELHVSPEDVLLAKARVEVAMDREDDRYRSRLRWRWFSITAAAAAVVLALVWSDMASWPGANSTPKTFVYTTANGQQAKVTLPDGSDIVLNVGSRLEVPVTFGGSARILRLSGEALFTVAHSAGVPFTVVAGPTSTRVLGTRFVVRRFENDTTTLVAVQTGKVATGAVIVSAGHEAEFRQGHAAHVRATMESKFAFEDRVLVLDRVSLREAIPLLNRWFDADVRLGDSAIGSRQLEGDMDMGSARDLAEMLEVVFDLHVVRNGKKLTLYPKG